MTQHALLESEEKFRLLFEKSPDPVLLLDGDVFIDCNEAAVASMGCRSKDALIGAHPWDLSPTQQPDGSPSERKAREVLEATVIKGTHRFEWLHLTFAGQELLMDVSLTTIPIGGRKIFYTVWRDMTSRKKAEEALLVSQLRLSEAMDLARIVHWELDPGTETFLFNDPFYTLYGTTAQREGGYLMAREEYGKRFVHPEDLWLYEEAKRKRTSHVGPEFFHEFEHRIIRRDGEVRDVITRIRASRDAIGRISRCYGANQDITERKQTEMTLRESEERYRIAIEHSNDGVAIMRGTKHVFVNQRFLAMFGYDDVKEILGTSLFVTVHPDDYERVIEINRQNIQNEPAPLRYEFKGVRRDGTTIRVEVSSTRVVYQGQPAALAYLRDVTDRLQAEELLRRSQKMEAVGTLSAGIAHDFNNILTAILGFADIGSEVVPAGSKAKRYLLHVLHAAHRGKDLVTQILSFSRKGDEELRPIELAAIAKESVKMLRASLPRTIQIREDITSEPSTILANPTQIQQIIMNLGTNAAHAMREKGGQMTVQTSFLTVTRENAPAPDLTPGPYLKLSISDTGTGMEKGVMERLFDPFFTTKPRGEGTGLGLWVVHSIIKNHRGVITVRSVPGEGSVFEVFLPSLEEQRPQPNRRRTTDVKGDGHILVVDDEADLVELEKEMVEGLGYSATGVSDSFAALDLFRENPGKYNVVLADQTMPGMTGIDLARELILLRADIPVVLITGYRDEVNAKEATEAGIKIIVSKPMTKLELGAAIKQVFAGRAVK